MTTTARVLADSTNPAGVRLTTLEVHFPRFLLPEFNTHRVLSRNFRSSRAVPVARLIEEVRTNPFVPLAFTANQKGMQGAEADALGQMAATKSWLSAASEAADHAHRLTTLGIHKQHANRLLEPFLYVDGVVTATEWDGFFRQRLSPLAQPEFEQLAARMSGAIEGSHPNPLAAGEWHLPYVSPADRVWALDRCGYGAVGDDGTVNSDDSSGDRFLLQLSVARCARVSHKPFDSDHPDRAKDLDVYRKMLTAEPPHWSPFEHACRARNDDKTYWFEWHDLRNVDSLEGITGAMRSSNVRGWTQFRKLFTGEDFRRPFDRVPVF